MFLSQEETNVRSFQDQADLRKLYELAFPSVARYVGAKGGNLEDARDVFHDAVLVYIEKVAKQESSTVQHEIGYLIGISKNLWLRRQRSQIRHTEYLRTVNLDEQQSPQPIHARVLDLLAMTSQACLDLLRACFFGSNNMREVAEELGYANAHTVSVQKYKCIAKLKSSIETHHLKYEDFLE